MARRNIVIDAEEFSRRRGVAALLRGSSLDVEDVPRRPNALVWGGAVMALLIAAGSAGSAYATGRAPSGWRQDGALVIDRESGARFVAKNGLLRPAPTLTAALLAGAREEPMLVAHEHVSAVGIGAALPGADLPERPPALPATPTGLTACVSSSSSVEVFQGAPAPAPTVADGLLVQAPSAQPAQGGQSAQGEQSAQGGQAVQGGAQVYLVSGRRAHPLDPASLPRLGYSQTQVRTVPAAWLALVPQGSALAPLALPAQDPAGSIAGLGAAGDVVRAEDSDTLYWIAGGRVHPFANATSQLLAPAPVATYPEKQILAAPLGEAVGIIDAPAAPPTVPAPEVVTEPCVRSRDGLTVMFTRADDLDTRPALAQSLKTTGDDSGEDDGEGAGGGEDDGESTATRMTWHARAGQGALLGPESMDQPSEEQVQGTGGMRLIADGRSYEFADTAAVQRLGYRREQTVLLPQAWLDLFPAGAPLVTVQEQQ
ncbi:hypothetical protein GTQ99_04510 [Kineococcus sp. T13]|uniref:type VII secretion protein EccB n=1 Tax=Kineococcus vitellinus TaxID=2696565 RepID=UPI001412A4B1|nr:hypothetical protein [Kineococcus vitellinus]